MCNILDKPGDSQPEKTADISQRHHRFPREMTAENRLQKTSILMKIHYPDLGSAYDCHAARRAERNGNFAVPDDKAGVMLP